MKRLILCTACANGMLARIGDGTKYPGEHVKYVKGLAKNPPPILAGQEVIECDYCEAPLPLGTDCQAVTIWADNMPNPYEPWESEFIEIKEG
jgi:hypothetical protein